MEAQLINSLPTQLVANIIISEKKAVWVSLQNIPVHGFCEKATVISILSCIQFADQNEELSLPAPPEFYEYVELSVTGGILLLEV